MATIETDSGKVKAGRYEAVLEEMRKRWDYATDEWRDARTEGATDMRYCSGDPWDADDRKLREDAGRPVLAFDEFSQYVNQLINEIRQHKRAIKVTPVGYGANDKLAEFRQDLIRQIEYRSNAQQAYTSGFENTVQRSYGFWRVVSKHVNNPDQSGGNGGAFDQELLIKALPNPDLVTVDPDIQDVTGADMGYAWISESWPLAEYKRKFPKARIQDFDPEMAKLAPDWMDAQRIRVAEYWTIEKTERELLLFTVEDASIEVFKDDLDKPEYAIFKDLEPAKSRMVESNTVMQYLTNGFEVLGEPTEWAGSSIPIICCFGKVMYVDEGSGSKRQILSLPRLARDPAMLLSYYRTCEAELIGMTPKIPYMIRRGSLTPEELVQLQKSLHEPVAVIQVETTSDRLPAGQVYEMPQRQPYEPPIQPLEIGAESCRRAIQAAMGISTLPTSAQRKNEKSGKALQEIRNAEQQGSFHFIDSYENAITRTGAILEELIDAHYDTARNVIVRNGEDKPQERRINDPEPANFPQGQTEPVMLGKGKYDVTLSTGPSYDSEREAANDFADTLLQTPFANVIADLAVKLKNLGPVGDAIAKRLHAMLPPPILQAEQEGQPSPEQMQAMLQQAQQQIQQLQQGIQQAQQIIQTDQVKAEAEFKREQLRQQADTERTGIKAKADEKIERLRLVSDLLKTRATLEVKQTEAMIDQATAELDRNVALAGEREARQDASTEADKARDFQASEGAASRAHEAAQDRQAAADERSVS